MRQTEKVTLVTLAPLTNIATLFTNYPAVKERIRNADLGALRALAQRALGVRDAAAVRALAAELPIAVPMEEVMA